jgi:peroxiredoxin
MRRPHILLRLASEASFTIQRSLTPLFALLSYFNCAVDLQVCTPCNWMQTEDVFINTDITSDAANMLFPKGFMEIKPWFRLTPQPDTEEK